MLDGTYKISVDTPMGTKQGKITLKANGSQVSADIDAPVIGKQHVKGQADGDTFKAHGVIKMLLLGKHEYDVAGEVKDGLLTATISTKSGTFAVEGTRIG